MERVYGQFLARRSLDENDLKRKNEEMADILFFSPYQLNQDYTYKTPDRGRTLSFGEYQFTLVHTAPVHEMIHGKMCFVGYIETWRNEEISQEETDRLWNRYLEETGQVS